MHLQIMNATPPKALSSLVVCHFKRLQRCSTEHAGRLAAIAGLLLFSLYEEKYEKKLKNIAKR